MIFDFPLPFKAFAFKLIEYEHLFLRIFDKLLFPIYFHDLHLPFQNQIAYLSRYQIDIQNLKNVKKVNIGQFCKTPDNPLKFSLSTISVHGSYSTVKVRERIGKEMVRDRYLKYILQSPE